MTFTDLRRITLNNAYGELTYDGDDLVMPIMNSFGDKVGTVEFYDDLPDGTLLEDVDTDKLEVKYFDFT